LAGNLKSGTQWADDGAKKAIHSDKWMENWTKEYSHNLRFIEKQKKLQKGGGQRLILGMGVDWGLVC